MITLANPYEIQATINAIVNANPVGEFSHRIATDNTSDKRYSDAFITAARRMSASRVMRAIGTNLNHPFWSELSTRVTVAHGAKIPPYFGEMGGPEIQPVAGSEFIQGKPATTEEVESYRGDAIDTALAISLFSNPLGETQYTHLQRTASGVKNPISAKYSTTNGYLAFSGYECRIPMIQVPDNGGRAITGTVSVSDTSTNVVGLNAFQVGDLGKRLIVTSEGQLILVGVIQSLTTTTLTDDTAVLDTSSEYALDSCTARTEDVYLAANDLLDNSIPLDLAATVVRLAIGLLVKEGDSLRQIAAGYAGQGEVDLIQITQGAAAVNALDVTRAIQTFQRTRQ